MSKSNLPPLAEELQKLTNRRKLITSVGTGAVTLVVGRSVLGRSDDEHDDDHDDDHHDHVKPAGTVPADSADVRIDDDDEDGFEPGIITMDMGDSVTWVNVDDEPHTATGADFDSGKIDPGQQATVVFNAAGSFPYSCSFHPIMTGVVEVRDESGNVPSQPTASPEASPLASPSAGDEAAVSISNLAFDPTSLEVPVGTTVVWTNNEDIPHTVRATEESFRSETLQRGDTFSHQFTEAGTFDYFCEVHPSMDATIIVTE